MHSAAAQFPRSRYGPIRPKFHGVRKGGEGSLALAIVLMVHLILLAGALAAPSAEPANSQPLRWWKGNLHTHTLWSDGNAYPEMVVEWYKTNGYNFLALSDHNITLQGQRWLPLTNNLGGERAFQEYLQRFGKRWLDLETVQNTQMIRLRPLPEFRYLFEEPNRFLLIPSEEISIDHDKIVPIHVNATNLRDYIPPQLGTSILDTIQQNVDAVIRQREKLRRPMLPHINHPNFGWAITAEDLMRVHGDRFFEVYNGHPGVMDPGDAYHASTERVWDIVLTFRIAELKLEPMFALAVDDAHHYHSFTHTNFSPGRGWVMVRSANLTPEALIASLQAGDFYASSGVRLKDVRREPARLSLEIEPEPGITYVIQFIGTRKGFDPSSQPGPLPPEIHPERSRPVTRHYSRGIGAVLATVEGTSASYELKGDEIYVRAKIISTKAKVNAPRDEAEQAWTQPLVPAAR